MDAYIDFDNDKTRQLRCWNHVNRLFTLNVIELALNVAYIACILRLIIFLLIARL